MSRQRSRHRVQELAILAAVLGLSDHAKSGFWRKGCTCLANTSIGKVGTQPAFQSFSWFQMPTRIRTTAFARLMRFSIRTKTGWLGCVMLSLTSSVLPEFASLQGVERAGHFPYRNSETNEPWSPDKLEQFDDAAAKTDSMTLVWLGARSSLGGIFRITEIQAPERSVHSMINGDIEQYHIPSPNSSKGMNSQNPDV